MPPERDLPVCPAAVIVAKPKRTRWCLEEAWDLATVLGLRVYETGNTGVFLLWGDSPHLSREGFLDSLRRYRFSFASRVVLSRACIRLAGEDRDRIVEEAYSVIKKALSRVAGGVRLIIALRGKSKGYLDEHAISDFIRASGLRVDRRGPYILDLEGFDNNIIVSWGRPRSCGYQCLLVGVD